MPALSRLLLPELSFTRGQRNWGYAFRFGLLAITPQDFRLIAAAMGAGLPAVQRLI